MLQLLEKVNFLPQMILLENVMGFEVSQAREKLIQVLKNRNYRWKVSKILLTTSFSLLQFALLTV